MAGFINTTPVGAYSSGNVAAATATATIPAPTNGQTAYLTGFHVTGSGATAASVVALTVTGLLGGTATYNVVVPAGVGVNLGQLNFEFIAPLQAAAPNTAIVVSLPSLGAGNTNAAVVAYGGQL